MRAPPIREYITDKLASSIWQGWFAHVSRQMRRRIVGDGTRNVNLRKIGLAIDDGTNANTIKYKVFKAWNATETDWVDNVAKGNDAANHSLSTDGVTFTLKNAILGGTCIMSMAGSARVNRTLAGGQLNAWTAVNTSEGIEVKWKIDATGQDLTVVVDTGSVWMDILYLTS